MRSYAILRQNRPISALDGQTCRRRLGRGDADWRGRVWRRADVVAEFKRERRLDFLCAHALFVTLGGEMTPVKRRPG